MSLPCGCTPDASGYGYCGECTRKLREKIWREMPAGEQRYDRTFAPAESAELDARVYSTSCSCHISAPCSYCVNLPDPDREDQS